MMLKILRPNCDDIKIKRKVSFFSLHSFIFLSMLTFLHFVPLLHGLEAAFRSCEIKVKYGTVDLPQKIE